MPLWAANGLLCESLDRGAECHNPRRPEIFAFKWELFALSALMRLSIQLQQVWPQEAVACVKSRPVCVIYHWRCEGLASGYAGAKPHPEVKVCIAAHFAGGSIALMGLCEHAFIGV